MKFLSASFCSSHAIERNIPSHRIVSCLQATAFVRRRRRLCHTPGKECPQIRLDTCACFRAALCVLSRPSSFIYSSSHSFNVFSAFAIAFHIFKSLPLPWQKKSYCLNFIAFYLAGSFCFTYINNNAFAALLYHN